MTDGINRIIDRYYETKSAIDILTEQLDEMKQILIEQLKATENHKLENDKVSFSLRQSVTYQYSPVVEEAEKLIKTQTMGIKSMKADEEKRGVAKILSVSYSPVMTKKK